MQSKILPPSHNFGTGMPVPIPAYMLLVQPASHNVNNSPSAGGWRMRELLHCPTRAERATILPPNSAVDAVRLPLLTPGTGEGRATDDKLESHVCPYDMACIA